MISVKGTALVPPSFIDINKDSHSIVISFTDEYGTIKAELSHDQINALRLMLMHNTYYPPHEWSRDTVITEFDLGSDIPMEYDGYGPLQSETTGKIWQIENSPSTITLGFGYFQFDLEPFIVETEEGIEYLPPYYYYENKSYFAVSFNKDDLLESMIRAFCKVLPYERFSRLNRPALSYIKTESTEHK